MVIPRDKGMEYSLSYDVWSVSDITSITSCIKISEPLVVYIIFSYLVPFCNEDHINVAFIMTKS